MIIGNRNSTSLTGKQVGADFGFIFRPLPLTTAQNSTHMNIDKIKKDGEQNALREEIPKHLHSRRESIK